MQAEGPSGRIRACWLVGILVLTTLFSQAGAQEEGRGATLARLVRTRQNEAAITLLREMEPTPPYVYLRGRLLERLGRDEQAAETYGELATPFHDSAKRRAFARARTGNCERATPLLREVERPPAAASLARAYLAECAYLASETREQHEAAQALLRAAIDEDGRDVDTYALRWMLAVSLETIGETENAAAARRSLYLARPTHPDASSLEIDLESLSGEERLSLAERLAEHFEFERAAEVLDVPPPRGLRGAFLHARGRALFRAREHYEEAAAVLREAARRQDNPFRVPDEFYAARALSRADHDDEAIRAYRRFARVRRGSPLAPKAEMLAAWLEMRLGRTRPATRAFSRLLRRSSLPPAIRRDATWNAGMIAFRSERYAEAQRHFSSYASLSESVMDVGCGRYWSGRAAEKAGQRSTAIRAYQETMRVAVLHWYGLWAKRRLAGLGIEQAWGLSPPEGDSAEDPNATIEAPPGVPALALTLSAIGLLEDAESLVRSAAGEIRNQAPRRRRRATLARAYQSIRADQRAYRLAHNAPELRQEPRGEARWAWMAAYPRPVWETVQREAAAASVPWAYVYAAMRQESAYAPAAISRTGAIGLLQLMPEAASRVAASRGLRPPSPGALFDPHENVRLGIGEIASLFEEMDGALPLVIAAYNAGASRAHRWSEECDGCETDLFVETISFQETRNYVRRVSSHMARYTYLYGGVENVPLPERIHRVRE